MRQIPFRAIRILFDNATELRVFSTFQQLAWNYRETPAYEEILPLGDLSATGQDRAVLRRLTPKDPDDACRKKGKILFPKDEESPVVIRSRRSLHTDEGNSFKVASKG